MQYAFETCGKNEYCFIQLKLNTTNKCGNEDAVVLYSELMVGWLCS
jgi:hypothetical protein